jgi:glutamate-1-semialdehyde 2,1-aminomutase
MSANPLAQKVSGIVERYREKTPGSAALFARAKQAFPSGLTHDSRVTEPHTLHVSHAKGPRKWDVDGNEYVDYFGGHGAMLLGHCAPQVVEAVQRQVALGTHFGSAHELEVRWAELIKRLVPCAERVRFTSSGTEATLLALRLARAHTGRDKIVRFLGHFHGWHDHVAAGSFSHYDGSRPVGVLRESVDTTILMPADNVESVMSLLESRDDIAAVIVEPSGASWGQVPLPPGFLQGLRVATAGTGAVLIFDEVITGFRASPGGAQQAYGITADLCTLGKIVSGALPGGALAGRRDIMDALDFEVSRRSGREKVAHQGTFNANPLVASAAIATLETVAKGEVCTLAIAATAKLCQRLNEMFVEERTAWASYHVFSLFHIFTNPGRLKIDPLDFDPLQLGFETLKKAKNPGLVNKLRLAMLVNGVDIQGAPGGSVSATHGEREIDATVEAMRQSVRMLRSEGEVDPVDPR